MRAQILALSPGDRIGAENELVERYGVSRPTLRQAAAVLTQEGVLDVRRGVSGGYYVREPDTTGVSHMASLYLQSRGASLAQILEARAPVKAAATAFACRCDDAVLIERLRDFQRRDHALIERSNLDLFKASEVEFSGLVHDMAGNEVLRMLEALLDEMISRVQPRPLLQDRPDRIEEMRRARDLVIDAMLKREMMNSAQLARKRVELALSWAIEDVGERDIKRPLSDLSKSRSK